jgi:UDP-N-acetylglucosamine--N-acetylmuramyl-(pentapeptide) pyrophosphoryl-undecaprenol N-acetylglucosamine transferase
MGGFASFPGGLMASLLHRPLVIHEQNAIAGLANRVLAVVADRVLAGFPRAFEAASHNLLARALPRPGPVQVTGNPVRPEIARVAAPEQRYAGRHGSLRLLVVGGSLGAQVFNATVPRALQLLPRASRPQVIHQSGSQHFDTLRDQYQSVDVQAELVPFLDDMAERYAACDVLLCRAGALTVAEIAVAGVAAILVPFPSAVDDHQSANARFLSDHAAAVLLPQSEFTAARLAELLFTLTREQLLTMACAARALGQPEAVTRVARSCAELAP